MSKGNLELEPLNKTKDVNGSEMSIRFDQPDFGNKSAVTRSSKA